MNSTTNRQFLVLFTFQHVSINSFIPPPFDWSMSAISVKLLSIISNKFTFQHLSITSESMACVPLESVDLHSNMYLLIPYQAETANADRYNLHSNMYLLILALNLLSHYLF